MQEEMEFSQETLRQMEPLEEAMVQGSEPINKPVSCSEQVLYTITLLFSCLVPFIHWSPLHTIAIIVALCFIVFELFNLLIPPRFSMFRIIFLFSVLFQTKIFFN